MTDPYQRGFAIGERMAWKHRKQLQRLLRQQDHTGAYWDGFWAGYEPRSIEWRAR